MSSEYSVHKFVTLSVDKRGHSSHLRVAITPSMGEMIGQLIAAKKVAEYKTPQDVVRDALYHRLQWLSEQEIIEDDDLLFLYRMEAEAEARKNKRETEKALLEALQDEWRAIDRQDEIQVGEFMNAALACTCREFPVEISKQILRLWGEARDAFDRIHAQTPGYVEPPLI